MGEFRKFLEDELSGLSSKVGDDPGYRFQTIKNDKKDLEYDKTLNMRRKFKKTKFSKKS